LNVEDLRRELAAALKMWSQESSLEFIEMSGDDEQNADIQGALHQGPEMMEF
jgi:hypothetical protein